MCGLSGFTNIKDNRTRFFLTLGLADGIDTRGGHAAGYLSLTDVGKLRYARVAKKFCSAGPDFLRGAASGSRLCMMHARFATCGKKDEPKNAHPFAIQRNGNTVLWGAHNGVVNSWQSAREHGRDIDVDSQELFELIADGDFEGITKISGYGVITWIERENPGVVKICKLSPGASFEIYGIDGNSLVWASTAGILSAALARAKLKANCSYDLECGKVYEIHSNLIRYSGRDGLKLAESTYYSPSQSYGPGWYEDYKKAHPEYFGNQKKEAFKPREQLELTDDSDAYTEWADRWRVY